MDDKFLSVNSVKTLKMSNFALINVKKKSTKFILKQKKQFRERQSSFSIVRNGKKSKIG